MKYDKRNGDVVFTEDTHKYQNIKYPDRNYISVTTLIGKFHEEFDTDFWSSYKALEALIGADEFKSSPIKRTLLDKKKFDTEFVHMLHVDYDEFIAMKDALIERYARTNREACERGSLYHKQKEDALYNRPPTSMEDLGIKLPELTGNNFTVIRDDCDMTRTHDAKAEFLLYWSCEDNIVNLAGQADMIVKDGNDIYILDHKTNAKGIETHSYYDKKKKTSKRMYSPVNHLEDCDLVHYTLQLSFYAWMLKRLNPEFNIKLLRLMHIDGDGLETEYDLEYREADVEAMLKAYKKSLILAYHRKYGKFPLMKSSPVVRDI
jgi:hypothetical protein